MRVLSTLVFASLFLLCGTVALHGQTVLVQPFLQDAFPTAITIVWETDSGEESLVEWGLTDALGESTTGSALTTDGGQLHEVTLTGLERFTKYHYKVVTGSAESAVQIFKTPPFASDEQSARIVAMSDMQQDGTFPDKFEEIVNEGIIDYLADEFGGDVADNLALVLIPGDLVTYGDNYSSWEDTFFDPSENLFGQVPVYPVLGNHEVNTSYYFQYFKLPDNGTPGFEEHWWHKDYGNVRIIGLDSNAPFTNEEQLDWLNDLLDETCQADSIDFVFAQLHHPHKSELWTPGESNYTGDVIGLLEEFSTACGKPSVHFFGHTHGYSRGHSRDHKHLWINAASAGGAIDNWGEFPNFDYDEFAVSQDTYGFVSVDVTAGDNPKITVKRLSRGDQDAIADNVLEDSLVMYKYTTYVQPPTPVFPVGIELTPECVVLHGDAFASDNEQGQHGQSHWQVSTSETDFTSPVAESWKNFENWYFDIDTQADDDLTDEAIGGLAENTQYWWRVRYRDRELNWSDWSESAWFITTESVALSNLLVNGGGEDGINNWALAEGNMESLESGECNGVAPYAGTYYLAVGGLCEESPVGRCYQDVDLTSYTDSIAMGDFPVQFGGYLSDYSGDDVPEMRAFFLNAAGDEIGSSATLTNATPSWLLVSETLSIPVLTQTIRIELEGTRNVGTDNDSYFDELFVRVGTMIDDCATVGVSEHPYSEFVALVGSPNPASELFSIAVPVESRGLHVHLVDAKGNKVSCTEIHESGKISLDCSLLPAGTYVFWVRDAGRVLGSGKVVVEH